MGKKTILKNKVALVTGASKGIGYGIVLAMAREGADIVINYYTNRDGANKAAKEVRRIGRKALVAQADVSKSLDVNKMVKLGLKTFGRIDILINNAGIAIWKPFFEVSEEIWDRTLEINLKGAFLCSQKVARHMKENRGGCIINISSLAAYGALDCLVPYCASKGGMSLLTKSMAVELAPYNIRVNSVAPGTIAVQRNFGLDPGYPQTWTPYIPTGRVGQVKDVAGVVIFLASDEAGYITGQTIYVDGGETSYVPMPRADFARSPEEKGG